MFNRRKFLKIGAVGAVVATAGASVPLVFSQSFASAQPGAVVAGGNKALVIIELNGGNDGLNTVIPYEDSTYYNLRPNIAIPAGDVLKIGNDLGLHPAMKSLHKLYQDGKMAIVQGVGYPNPNLSHFEASDIWQSAQFGNAARTGWLGRYLEQFDHNAKLAASITDVSPLTLYNRTTLVPSINGLENLKFSSHDYYYEDGAIRQAYARRIQEYSQALPIADFIKSSTLDALSTADALQKRLKDYEPDKSYPETDLARQLWSIAQMLKADLPFRIFYVQLSGFDTHTAQLYEHAALLEELSDSVTAFYQDLKSAKMADNVLLMTFSEFGRRPQESGSGTDHGTAQPMFLIGNPVKGGIYGKSLSLSDLDEDNLKHTVDFRQVYATVLKDWLKIDPAKILGNSWQPLPLLAG
jgi:uncharacterized protein (DUF1501 family)